MHFRLNTLYANAALLYRMFRKYCQTMNRALPFWVAYTDEVAVLKEMISMIKMNSISIEQHFWAGRGGSKAASNEGYPSGNGQYSVNSKNSVIKVSKPHFVKGMYRLYSHLLNTQQRTWVSCGTRASG